VFFRDNATHFLEITKTEEIIGFLFEVIEIIIFPSITIMLLNSTN